MARTNIRVTGLIVKDNKILLIHRFRDGNEYWTIPGGAVEEGETITEALIRELKEEVNADLIDYRHIFDYEQSHPVNSMNCHFFVCDVGNSDLKLGDGPERLHYTETNQYIPEWVDLHLLTKLNLYPNAAEKILQYYENR